MDNQPTTILTNDNGDTYSVTQGEATIVQRLQAAVATFEKAVETYGTPEDPHDPTWRLPDRMLALEYARKDLEKWQ